jgi:hypothetical protein
MATVRARMQEPVDQVLVRLRQVAGEQGWTAAGHDSSPRGLVLKKGVSAWSWGSEMTIDLEATTETETLLTFTTREVMVLTDWGRGARQVRELLQGLGAERL